MELSPYGGIHVVSWDNDHFFYFWIMHSFHHSHEQCKSIIWTQYPPSPPHPFITTMSLKVHLLNLIPTSPHSYNVRLTLIARLTIQWVIYCITVIQLIWDCAEEWHRTVDVIMNSCAMFKDFKNEYQRVWMDESHITKTIHWREVFHCQSTLFHSILSENFWPAW